MGFIRKAGIAGTFYPAEPHILAPHIGKMLDAARAHAQVQGTLPKALIVPHAGTIYSGPVAAGAYARIATGRDTMTRVVLIGPAHRMAFRGIAVSAAEAFDTPLGRIALDRDAIARLQALPFVSAIDQAFDSEHCLEVQLPFLQSVLSDFTLVPMLAGGATAEQAEAALDLVWGGDETLILVSSDLSHFHDYDQARAIDDRTRGAIERLDYSAIGPEQACGRIGIGGLLRAARHRDLDVETIDVRNSGDTAGPRDRVVGYGAWAFTDRSGLPQDLAPHRALLLTIARDAIQRAVTDLPPADLDSLPDALRAPGACFVTLRKHGALRGCIGSAAAWRPLAEDVADNARHAARDDPRFLPVSAAELDSIKLSLALLTPPVAMMFSGEDDLLAQLRPGRDGLVIKEEGRSALFLPSVWEQLPDTRRFLSELKKKAGFAPDYWSPAIRVLRFHANEIS